MLNKIIKRFLEPRHYWRDLGFDELSEIYANRLISTLAMSLVGIFIPVYLYGLGYSVAAICGFFAMHFAFRVVFDLAGSFVVGRFGAKRTIVASQLIQLGVLGLFATLPAFRWPLVLCALLFGTANSLYFVAFHTDFSKVRHASHGGKEICWASNFEKIGAAAGPLVGGVLATIFHPQLIFVIACVLVLMATIPFLATREAIKTRQHITFRGLPIIKHCRDYLSVIGAATENTVSVALWPLYLTLVLGSTHIYGTIGLLASIGVASSFIFIHVIGKLIDNRRIRTLFQYGVLANAAVHLVRPFIHTIGGAAFLNIANEQATNSYRLPYIKGYYDAASELPGYRIAYIASMEAFADFWKCLFWTVMAGAAVSLSALPLIRSAFVSAAILTLLIFLQGFSALRR